MLYCAIPIGNRPERGAVVIQSRPAPYPKKRLGQLDLVEAGL